jgi:hypothetical protein
MNIKANYVRRKKRTCVSVMHDSKKQYKWAGYNGGGGVQGRLPEIKGGGLYAFRQPKSAWKYIHYVNTMNPPPPNPE